MSESLTREEIVRMIMANILNLATAEISEKTTPQTVRTWDSAAHLRLILALEDRLGIGFADGEIATLTSLSGILGVLETRLASR